jgi:peptidoglycan/xylan/chitin deacetylase (PgdA/CDA1 family)
MHHLQGASATSRRYLRDITEAAALIDSPLFRPPHGIIRWKQAKAIKERYNLIMYDLVTRDYSKRLNADQVFNNVKRYARNGSIIVFHDSLKASRNMRSALPRAIEWLLREGYEFHVLPME